MTQASPAQRRPRRPAVDYAALRAMRTDSRAVFHPPPPLREKRKHDAAPPLTPGKPCRYRRQYFADSSRLTLISVRDGVATVQGAGGNRWQEPMAALVGVRE